jgi:hypothetical protein
MEGRIPNLLIIGAMKSGTSSLHGYLSLHPEIFMSIPKEIHYFDGDNYLLKSVDWYKGFFKTDKKIAGCSPQNYTKCHNKHYQHVPERIYEHCPDVKLIYIVRDPIERYKSHILESYYGDPLPDIEYSEESGNYLKTGKYFMQINEYLKYFSKEQIHILSLEDLIDDKLNELNAIFQFLGVAEMDDASQFDFVSKSSESKTFPRVVSDHILYRAGRKVLPGLSDNIASYITRKYFSHRTSKPELTFDDEVAVKKALKEDIERFKELTGKAFPQWNI